MAGAARAFVFTRVRRRSGRDERDATEVTGGHPSLGTTTRRREVQRHGAGICVNWRSRVKRFPALAFTGRVRCGESGARAVPSCVSPPPRMCAVRRLRRTPEGPPDAQSDAGPHVAQVGPHHHGCPAPARRRPGGVAIDAAVGRRRCRPHALRGARVQLLPQGGGREVLRAGDERRRARADRHGQPPSPRVLPGGDRQPRCRARRRAGVRRAIGVAPRCRCIPT